tara:strand:- start:251 stop:544 length:294 start_codon:yes stop_codon:yes gene_type:complete
MKFELNRYFSKSISVFFSLIPLFYLKCDLLNAENLYFEEMQIDSSTKTGEKKIIPDNPFEIVEMIRRYNSMNDATNPSDAIDEALNSFEYVEEKEEI